MNRIEIDDSAVIADQALVDGITQACVACWKRSAAIITGHGRRVPQIDLDFYQTGTSAGQCRIVDSQAITLRFNIAIAKNQPEDFIEKTVPHEIAHAVTWLCFPGAKPHGVEWKSVMRQLGQEQPKRCHDYDTGQVQRRTQRRWNYLCACQQHQLTTVRHNRVQNKRAQYHCKQCGQALQRAYE